jgi:hypothetical protein
MHVAGQSDRGKSERRNSHYAQKKGVPFHVDTKAPH